MTVDNVELVRQCLHTNRKLTYDDLERETGISRGGLERILNDHLKVKKKMCWFVPHRLSDEQRKLRVEICQENLRMWKNYGMRRIDRIVTGDETYVHYYEAPTHRESKLWVFEDEDPPQVVDRDRTVGKVLYAIFFRTTGLVQAVKLEGQKSVTALWYTTQCLPKVFGDAGKTGLILHHDNASSHTASLTSEYLAKNNIKTIRHPPYSPDLAMCDF